ncbi:MAG: HD domain-containing protein, partial [Cyanobacteria bacterium P01_D01_bin.44]
MLDLWSQEDYRKAYRFAAEAHQGQLFPGTELPYLMHLSFVCMEVMAALRAEPGHDENLAVQCALLHDVIEDTPVTFDQVQTTFGAAVANGVLALSKNRALAKPEQMSDSLRRIQQQPQVVWMVKLADRITNLHAPPAHWDLGKITRYQAEAQTIYEALRGASPYLARRICD